MMKVINKLVIGISVLLLSVATLGSSALSISVHADDIEAVPIERYVASGNISVEMKSENSVVISDANTLENIEIEFIDNHNAIIKDIDGLRKKVYMDGMGNVYINGKLEFTQADTPIKYVVEKERSKRSLPDPNRKDWKYLDTMYYDTKTQGDARALALGLLSFVPFIGPVFGIATIIDTVRNMGSPNMYVTVKRYYLDGYQFYKYVSSFYADSARKKHVKTLTEVKKMW